VGDSFESVYQYEYIDLNNDGIKEIIQSGEECHYWHSTFHEEEKWIKKIGCKDIPPKEYKFNGTEYVSE
jgi:hypothetical protein